MLAGLARRLGAEGSVLAIDLAETGLLARELGSPTSQAPLEPRESVAVVAGPTADAVGDVVLSLVPFDIGRGLGHVKSSASRCVVLVKAGRSTAERLTTVASAARTAGLDVVFVMLVGADESDAELRRRVRRGEGTAGAMTVLMLGRGRTRPGDLGPGLDRRLLAGWAAMFLNVLPLHRRPPSCSRYPAVVGQLISQGALPLAVLLALVANPRGLVRPNAYVVLLSAMCLVALMVSLHNPFVLGSTYRAIRFAGFVPVCGCSVLGGLAGTWRCCAVTGSAFSSSPPRSSSALFWRPERRSPSRVGWRA